MSRRQELQDATGVMEVSRPDGFLEVAKRTTPTNGVAGYATSCIWRNLAGGVGSTLYVNVGTNLSTVWVNIA